MMKVILVSLSTPTPYNVRAASALPFHLMRGMQETVEDEKVQVEVYTYNINEVDETSMRQTEDTLGAKIHLLDTPRWQQWMLRLHLLMLRVLLRYPLCAYYRLPKAVVEQIKAAQPDVLWIYGEELAGIAKHFPGMNIICTMPDCEAMYYHRLLRKRFATQRLSQILRYAFAYWQYRGMERDQFQPQVLYQFVGKADKEFFDEINPRARAVFVEHPAPPQPSLVGEGEGLAHTRLFHSPLRIVMPGRYDIYQKEEVDEILPELVKADGLKEHCVITFLGKGWDEPAAQLRASGWTVNIKTWAEDYAAELRQHDVALYPISVGTGTKGKVLDAFINGLLIIGTPFALENIDYGDDAILYHQPTEVIAALRSIIGAPDGYTAMAQRGCTRIRAVHDRQRVVQQLLTELGMNAINHKSVH